MFKLLDGSQTLGRGWTFWSCFLAVLAAALIYPVFADLMTSATSPIS